MNFHEDLIQGSQDWLDARCGVITASNVKKILSPLTFKRVKEGSKYALSLAQERITKEVEPCFLSDDMLRGMYDEIIARQIYGNLNDLEVKEVGFITEEFDSVTIGYSPDGLVGEHGLIEIKSRKASYQIETIVSNEMPVEYMLQIQTGLLVTKRRWCDFISYSNGLPFFVKRIYPNLELHQLIVKSCIEIDAEVCDMIEKYERNSASLFVTEKNIFNDDQEVVL